jgi:hypothetical protein
MGLGRWQEVSVDVKVWVYAPKWVEGCILCAFILCDTLGKRVAEHGCCGSLRLACH